MKGGKNTENRITTYLRKLKEERGCTQQEISDATGIPTGTLGKYFSGVDDESASFEIVRKIVVYLNGSLDELAGITHFEEESMKNGHSGSELSKAYETIIAGLEARLVEKDERLKHRDALITQTHLRAMEIVKREQKRSKFYGIISYACLALFVLIFIVDFLMPTVGWIRR